VAPSLGVDAAGRVHVSYYDRTKGTLKYATNTTGAWTASTVRSTGGVGDTTSLALDVAGKVHITYDGAAGSLAYVGYATNACP
jgi:hypothetical protein